jgi:hypothetical protein
MKIFNFFKKKKRDLTIGDIVVDNTVSEEVLLVSKSNYNRYENEISKALKTKVSELTSKTQIQFRKIKINTRIEEYDELVLEIFSGLINQLTKKTNGKPLIIGELIVKADLTEVEFHLSYLHGSEVKLLIDKEFKTSFGTWKVYEGHGVCLSACFRKDLYRKRLRKQTKIQKPERGIYV